MEFSRQEYWVWVAIPFSMGSFWPRDQAWVSCISGGIYTIEPGPEGSGNAWLGIAFFCRFLYMFLLCSQVLNHEFLCVLSTFLSNPTKNDSMFNMDALKGKKIAIVVLFCFWYNLDFPVSDGKSVCLQCGRPGFDPWVGKIPWRRQWQSTPVLWPGKSHGRRSLVGYSPWGHKESDTTEWLHFHTFTLSRCSLEIWSLGTVLSGIWNCLEVYFDSYLNLSTA